MQNKKFYIGNNSYDFIFRRISMAKKNKNKCDEQFKTLALAENESREKDTNVSHPSEKNVEEAKEFVDSNEK